MAKKKKSAHKQKKISGDTEITILPDQVPGEVDIQYQPVPDKSRSATIHPRQKIPPLKKGKEVSDETPTPPLKIGNS